MAFAKFLSRNIWHFLAVLVVVWSISGSNFVASQRYFHQVTSRNSALNQAKWIWKSLTDSTSPNPVPTNVFTYFRQTFTLSNVATKADSDLFLRISADSNAAIFLNGQLIFRKVTRFDEKHITADMIRLKQRWIVDGKNVIVVRHHNWGNITCFQRNGQQHAGLYIDSNFGLKTDTSWKYIQAPEFAVHEDQIIGVGGARRIRFPQIVDGRQTLPSSIHHINYDANIWNNVESVDDGPWPAVPLTTETTAVGRMQIGDVLLPTRILQAGISSAGFVSSDPYSIQHDEMTAKLAPNSTLRALLQQSFSENKSLVIHKESSSMFLTVDFGQPVHGFVQLCFASNQSSDVVVDVLYTEKPFDLKTGDTYTDPETGWINSYGIVGKGYGDRYITRSGDQMIEFPDERTLRWLFLHIRFNTSAATAVYLRNIAVQTWMYDVRDSKGRFQSGNTAVDNIANLSMIFAKVSMSDTYVDTTGREDAQWIEDARPRALMAARWFNDTALRQILIRHQVEGQYSNGAMHPFFPSNYPIVASTDWSLQWVAALYDDFVWTRSTVLVQTYWHTLLKYWDYVFKDLHSSGLWTGPCLNDIRVTPPCPQESVACASGIVTPWIIERLWFSVEMAYHVNQSTTAEEWKSIAQQMKTAFQQHFIINSTTVKPYIAALLVLEKDGSWQPLGIMQAAHTVAIYTNLIANTTLATQMMNYIFPEPEGLPPAEVQLWNNPTFLRRALKALSHVNQTARAIRLLKNRFSQYLRNSNKNPIPSALQGKGGPLPEYWISRIDEHLQPGATDNAQPDDGTGSHGWCSVALEWMHTHLLGVRDDYGADQIIVQPDDGSGTLPTLNGLSYTPHGPVAVRWSIDTNIFEVDVPSWNTLVLPPRSCSGKLQLEQQPEGSQANPHGNGFLVNGDGTFQFRCC